MAAPAGGAGSAKEPLHQPLATFLQRLVDEYEPTIPEEVARYYMQLGGARAPAADDDAGLARLAALAADHFVAALVHDALEFDELRRPVANADRCLRARDVALALQPDAARQGITSLGCEPLTSAAAPAPKAAPRSAKKIAATLLVPGTGPKVVPIVNGALLCLLFVLGCSAAAWPRAAVTVHLAVMAALATALLISINWFARELKKNKAQ
ncbi:hypothetical protein M885DRAFT_565890 [Pelagophyceae sp. CCMP2097]|nr:hypothetical protein M885DRAFT_565890 [Pelagophyceae sp. CCMP2097]